MSLFQAECDTFSALCWNVGTPVAYKALKALERRDWLWLTSIDVRPSQYCNAHWYALDAQIASFFKKFPGFDLGIDRKNEAARLFDTSEKQCFHANYALNPLLDDPGHYGRRIGELLSLMRKKMKLMLGRAPDHLSLDGRFGPGSTYLNQGDKITLAHKLDDDYSATIRAKSFLHSWDQTAWSRYAACGLDTVGDDPVAECQGFVLHPGEPYAIRDFTYVRGNRFTTVPKDAKKDRGICIEPSLNLFYQLALGDLISQRLKKSIGWDKQSCQEYHKVLARLGSLTGAVATIDLSNASDTVCINLVKLVLPPAWYRLLDDLRSSHTFIGGRWVRLEKFSSMGNGFTFELETAIFRVIIDAIVELEPPTEDPYTPGLAVSVFGDDMVVPTSCSQSVVAALKFFGFTPNEQKTFLKGPFRESCGGDYFAGTDVRPFYLKEICDQPHKLITLANGIRRSSRHRDDSGGLLTYRTAWFRCLDYIPRQIRICRGPESLGDLVIHDDKERWRSNTTIRNSIRYLRVWRPVPNRLLGWDQFRPGVVLAVALYGGSDGAPKKALTDLHAVRQSGYVPRIRGEYVSGYRFGRVAYS